MVDDVIVSVSLAESKVVVTVTLPNADNNDH